MADISLIKLFVITILLLSSYVDNFKTMFCTQIQCFCIIVF